LCCRIEDRAAWEVLMLWDRGELHGRDSCSGVKDRAAIKDSVILTILFVI